MEIPDIDLFPINDLGELTAFPDVMPAKWAITLLDGREIHLERIEQRATYGGMLGGAPMFPKSNVEVAMSQARKWDGSGEGRIMVIPAPITQAGVKRAGRDGQISTLPIRMLPPVQTFALFTSRTPARDPDEACSSGVMIWWQENYGIPQDPALLERIRAADWNTCAFDWTS